MPLNDNRLKEAEKQIRIVQEKIDSPKAEQRLEEAREIIQEVIEAA